MRWPIGVGALCLVLAAITLAFPAAPSYDPWSWLVWGREVVDLDLRTVSGPSWKPLPVLFTAPLSLLGDAAPELWLLLARAGTFGAVAAAVLLGRRLAGGLGAVLAGAFLLVPEWFWVGPLLGNSEGILIMCVLLAVERQFAGRHGQAFALWIAAGLLRPEAWPFLGLYALWLVLRDRGRVPWVVGGLALLPALWLLPELWGSGSLSRGADRAQQPGPDAPAFAERPAFAVVENAVEAASAFVFLGLLAGLLALGLRRVPRDAVTPALWLGGLGVAWLVLVAVMTEFGFSGITRYLATPLAIAHVLAGVGLAWALSALLEADSRRWLARAAAVGLSVLAAAAVVRVLSDWSGTLDFVERHGDVTGELDDAIERAGGERRVQECGAIAASFLMTPAVAWTLERHLDEVTAYPIAPGSVLHAQLVLGSPVNPARNSLADEPGWRIAARTEHWEVELACGE